MLYGKITLKKLILAFGLFIFVATVFFPSRTENANVANANTPFHTTTAEKSNENKVAVTCVQGSQKSRNCTGCKLATAVYLNSDCSTLTQEVEDTSCTDDCPKCIQDSEVSKECNGCNTSIVTYKNEDCTENTKTLTDDFCSYLCPLPVQQPLITTSCCKVCSQGKACGDSCISKSYTCHKAPGCACDR